MTVDKHVLEHYQHAEKNFNWLKKHSEYVEKLAVTNADSLMKRVHRYMQQPDDETMGKSDNPLDTTAEKLVKIYHQTARGVATLDIQADRIVVYVGRPKVELVGEVKVAYLFGRVQGLLGVCCECGRSPDVERQYLASFYVRALLSASEASYEAWKAIVERSKPVSTQDQLQHDLQQVVLSLQ